MANDPAIASERADASVLDGIQVPSGTYRQDLTDPRLPPLPLQRKYATDLLIRVCTIHGIDYEARPEGRPWPPEVRADLLLALEAAGEFVSGYLATRPTTDKKKEEELCGDEPNAE
ncbi:hypothetical protein GCM10017673_37490 [Streptosporangium violaceochromogenes]|nr:hypothetical protein GCM10017673_37490 [Streptosporangium violaceochromogenes]